MCELVTGVLEKPVECLEHGAQAPISLVQLWCSCYEPRIAGQNETPLSPLRSMGKQWGVL